MKVKFSGRRAIVCALFFSTLFAGSVASAPQVHATTTGEHHLAYLINQARTHYGRASLKLDDRLSYRARLHSKAMADKFTIFHTKKLASVFTGYNWSVCGENVGMGPTILSVHKAFMASPPHRANNLYRGYKRFGIGIVARNGIDFITVEFMG